MPHVIIFHKFLFLNLMLQLQKMKCQCNTIKYLEDSMADVIFNVKSHYFLFNLKLICDCNSARKYL